VRKGIEPFRIRLARHGLLSPLNEVAIIIARGTFVMLKSTGKKPQGQRARPKTKTREDPRGENKSALGQTRPITLV